MTNGNTARKQGLKSLIARLFPLFSPVPPKPTHREMLIQLVSIGRMCETGMRVFSGGTMTAEMFQLSKTLMVAYREILMAEYGISENDLLPAHEVMQIVRDMRGDNYNLPGTKRGGNDGRRT
jgi:hypothetical protein